MPKLTCNCGYEKDYDLPDRYDTSGAEGERTLSRILDGSLLTVVCPACATELRLEFPIVVATGASSLALVPESDRRDFLAGELAYELPEADRIAIGFSDLAEKVRISQAGLDDAAVEVLKYYLLSRALDDADDALDVAVVFQEGDQEGLQFTIVGLRPDEHGHTRVPRDVYERTVADLSAKRSEEPFSTFLRPPYVSVSRILSHLNADGD